LGDACPTTVGCASAVDVWGLSFCGDAGFVSGGMPRVI
jgi:hypothetical protein